MHESWTWGNPPFFALIRGPFGRAGYQVATLIQDDDFMNKIVLLFSCREKADLYRQKNPQDHNDWKVGDLPNWKRLHFFLDSMKPTASRICLNFEAEKGSNNLSVSLEEVLPSLEQKAEEASPSTDDT